MRTSIVTLLGLCVGTVASTAAPIKFSDRTEAAGVQFIHGETVDHQSGPMSGGGAVGDFNSDGYPDFIVLGGGSRADGLFINNRDGTFTDQAAQWEIDQPHRGIGATVGDYDGDGDDDIYLTSFGATDEFASHGKHRLYRNEGTHFVNVAEEAGVATTTTTHPDGYGASFGDYDRDGDLDLFVGAWHAAPVLGARLFQNQGDGSFINATPDANIITHSTRAFGAVWSDMDGDFYPELLVAGDFGTNRYYRNQRDGSFVELDPGSGLGSGRSKKTLDGKINDSGLVTAQGVATVRSRAIELAHDQTRDQLRDQLRELNSRPVSRKGSVRGIQLNSAPIRDDAPPDWTINKAFNAMGITAGDFNRDGLQDWFVTAIWPTSAFASDYWGNGLYINQGNNTYSEVSVGAGVNDGGWGWGTEAVDFNNDGWTDLVMTNGWPIDDGTTGASFSNERAYLWRNRGDLTFAEVGQSAGLTHDGEGRTLLTLDYDQDGDMDLVILSYREAVQLFRNDVIDLTTRRAFPADANWLQVVIDTQNHPALAAHGVGAKVTVETDLFTQTQQITTGGTFLGQSELVTHFGLGASNRIIRLTLNWGNGVRIERDAVRMNSKIRVPMYVKTPRKFNKTRR